MDFTLNETQRAWQMKARQFAHDVIRPLSLARDRTAGALETWDWDARQFDLIAGVFIQFATPAERARMFSGICRALKPGGLLLLEGYRAEQLKYGTGGPKVLEQLYTAPLLKEAFAAL